MTKTTRVLIVLTMIAAGGVAHAQRGSVGDGGRMPETMFPGVQPAPSMPEPRSRPVERYPDTESYARDSMQSKGYHVDDMTHLDDGSWRAEGTRNAVPTRPQGVPTKITIFPDGTRLEERE
ncbi:MAG: hypothetical protein JO339_05955 [Alphaproteobacteria bacterium]|nr:hypothetical protein [Alphaproteobacteria bacterium]